MQVSMLNNEIKPESWYNKLQRMDLTEEEKIMGSSDIIYADPAGNLTAIVRGGMTDPAERRDLAEKILASGKAEQVGFEVPPIMGGDCRLEMMGGEFCGNATRAYGYLCTSERYDGGRYRLHVEISGAEEPVLVQVNLDEQTAFARMPVPRGVRMIRVRDEVYPVVHMDGIDHMIVETDVAAEERGNFVQEALKAMGAGELPAAGVMFVSEDKLVPAVYVRETDSLVWESSCGSGSVATCWYLVKTLTEYDREIYPMVFREPGGVLQVDAYVENGEIVDMIMGGSVKISEE